ncbi:unnamed protein product [Urochloa decumbens]|uniref:Anaphase-promoting complex subunit 4 WD40 domain-containing protein n=1 Tax=Urochloa decumbens TaxID=240449 RepID=A0ABC9C6J9_9POAL
MSTQLEKLTTLLGHTGECWSLAWSPKPCNQQAQYMLASTGDDTTIVWHCTNSKWDKFQVLENKQKRSIRTCAWHPEGMTLAAGGCGNTINLWKYDLGKNEFSGLSEIYHYEGQRIVSLSWNSDGNFLLGCTYGGYIVIIKEISEGYGIVCRVSLEYNTPLSCAIWYPSGKMFAVAGKNIETFEVTHNDQEVKASESIQYKSNLGFYHNGSISGVSFASDKRMVSAGCDSELKFWLSDSTKRKSRTDFSVMTNLNWHFVMAMKEHKMDISCIDWSRCHGTFGNLIASACEARTIILYMPEHNTTVCGSESYVAVGRKTQAHEASIKYLKWHCQDPYILASAGSDGLVNIWKVTGDPIIPASSSRKGKRKSTHVGFVST